MKAAGLHLRVNLHCPVVAMGAVTATEEGLEPCRRHRLQGLPRRKRLKQCQGDRPIGIREQGQELREIGFQTRGELIAEHGAGLHQLGSIASQRPQLLSDLRVRQQGAIQHPIGPQQVRQHPRIAQIGLSAGDAKPIPMPIDRFWVNGVHGELLVQQRAHERTLGSLERHENVLRILSARSHKSHETLQALRSVVDRPGGQCGPRVVHQTIGMLGIRPIDPNQQHQLPPPTSLLRAPCAASPQPSIRAALTAQLPIGGLTPRRPRGEVVSRRRSSRKEVVTFSPGVAPFSIMVRHAL